MPKNIWKFLSGIGRKPVELTGEKSGRKAAEQSEQWTDRYAGRRPGKRMKTAAAVCVAVAAVCLAFTGCQGEKKNDKKLKDLEFTVVGEKETPPELQEMIGQKKTNPFKLTYADGQDMYIVIGEGPQKGGGFSIVVKELYLTENSVVIKTELMGPEKGETMGPENSYPVVIVKTAFCEEPVVFQ